MDNGVLKQLSSVAGLDADNPHMFANIDNMGLIAGTFDNSKLRQLFDARLKVPGLKQCSLSPSTIIKALELQLLNTSYASLFHSGQSLFHSKDYFYFTPFINLLDDIPGDYADLTAHNISCVLEEIYRSDSSRLFCACAAAVTMGLHLPVEAVYVDRFFCGIPANKVGKAAAFLAAQDAMLTSMSEEFEITEQSFAPDNDWGSDLTVNNLAPSLEPEIKRFGVSSIYNESSAYAEKGTSESIAESKRAQQLGQIGQGASFTIPEEEKEKRTQVDIKSKTPFVGLIMDLNTWKNTITPLLSSNQLLLCESTSRIPLWAQPLPSGVDKNSADAIGLVDWQTMRTYFKRLKYVITGAGACTSNNFELLRNNDLFMITHLPENNPLFAHLLEHYVPGKSLKPLTYRYSYGTGYTSFASDQHYQDHNKQQQQNIINQKENRRHRLNIQQKQRYERLLGTMLPICLFENQRVRPLLVYNYGHQEARRKFYIKIANAEKTKFQYKAHNLRQMFFKNLDQAKAAIAEVDNSLRLCSLQNVEFRGDLQGIRLELDLAIDSSKIARLIKRDCSMVILTNDITHDWEANELWLMYQRLRSQRHAPELTLQNILPVDPFYLSSRACHHGLMFLLNLGLLLHKATELQMRWAMASEGLALPAFKGSLKPDPRPSLFKFNNYLKEVGPSPALEFHINSSKLFLTQLPPTFKEIVEAMGIEWAKYYRSDAYHVQDYNGELRL